MNAAFFHPLSCFLNQANHPPFRHVVIFFQDFLYSLIAFRAISPSSLLLLSFFSPSSLLLLSSIGHPSCRFGMPPAFGLRCHSSIYRNRPFPLFILSALPRT